MAVSYYDEIELEDMEFDEGKQAFTYPFEISLEQLQNEEDIARCPSCTLLIRVIYDPLDFV
ncbi:Diphthamide biosynthesis protein 3 [Malassezia caprae]|uniref:Diphthamide biosynthesis protein 3 n=1 Tax=Malassezia caprae TaxID=1381934 RepID=A0AAF0IVG4_9BASI|nr:Diphthamide biosynthesis protein 3 [Malassezia caprae]